jgi:hypothetical protein
MPKLLSFLLAALLMLGATVLAADAPPANPATPAAQPEKADEKKAAAAPDDKKDEAAPKAAAPAGPGPKFPLQSEWFVHIADIMPDDKNVGDVEEAQALEQHALEDILIALQASSDEHLKANVDPDVTYKNLMREAEKYRGHVVQVRGLLETSERFPILDNKSGVSELYRGQTSTIYGQINTFLSIERPDPELIKHPVRITGIFMKRYAFKNRLAGEKLTWTPVILVKKVEAFSEADVGPAPLSNIAKLAIAMVVVLLLGRLAYRVTSVQSKSAKGNPFAKINRRITERAENKAKNAKSGKPAKPVSNPEKAADSANSGDAANVTPSDKPADPAAPQ